MASKLVVMAHIKSVILQNFSDLRNFLIMIKPVNDADLKWINTFIDMVEQIMEDIQNAEDLSDLSEWFKLNEMMEDWDMIEKNITHDYSQDTRNLIQMICDQHIFSTEDGPTEE